MTRFIVICLAFFPWLVHAQPADIVRLEKTGSGDYKMIYSMYYDGNSLWGYMDGGADLYLEYGFEGLLVQEIEYKGTTIKCEIFKMTGPLAAFGIFSVQRHNCRQHTNLSDLHCVNNYQVQLVRGNYYLSLINRTGEAIAQETSAEIASRLVRLIETKDIPFPENDYFNQNKQNLIFINGKISLGNVYPQALTFMENVSAWSMWIIPATGKKEPVIAQISFSSGKDMQEYAGAAFPQQDFTRTAQRKLKNGGMLSARKIDNYSVLQIDGKAGKDLKKLLGILVN